MDVDERADMPETTVKGRCNAGVNLLKFLKEGARKIRDFHKETTNFIQTADIIMEKLKGRSQLCRVEVNNNKKPPSSSEQLCQ